MKKIGLIFFWGIMVLINTITAQEIVLKSKELNTDRKITVYLPSSYDPARTYPTIYVLDGERIGSSVFGINEYLATCERTMPAIVVAIHQDTLRWADCNYNAETSELKASGKRFKAFLLNEIRPLVDSLFSTSSYSILAGHSFTATFAQLLLLDDQNPFKAFISISPYIPGDLSGKTYKWLTQSKLKKFLFLSTAEFDLSGHKATITQLNKSLERFEFPDHRYYFENYEKKTHLTLVPISIEEGLSQCFKHYSPFHLSTVSKEEIKKIDATSLKKYYANLNEVYDTLLPIRKEDLEFTLSMLETVKKWDQLNLLAEESIVLYPEFYAGYYSLGYYYEHLKAYEKALAWFELGYSKLGDDILNKEDFYTDIERLKKKK